ncbi:MAG TPA: energy-coupling factor transporter transmembrane component T [Clostridia bacterium]|nr:energy-coupling factor transporter transmembrane component T [Clostridia bacterium]
MLKNITIGQYYPGSSPLHKADPRTKIIIAFIFVVALILINTLPGFVMYSLFTLGAIIISNVPLKYTLKGLKPILFVIIFAAVLNIFFNSSGKELFKYGFIHITDQGLHSALIMIFRITLLVVGVSLLTLTTTPIMLTDGIEKLMKPLNRIGLPVHEIAMMMTIALRFIPTLLEETDKIMKAQAARGADFDTGNIIQRAKSFIPVLVPLFISAFRRADELAIAMESRCYRGSVGRTRMKVLRYGKIDGLIMAVVFMFVFLTLFLQYM